MVINKGKLIRAAAKAREGSVSPYSKFKVGAVLLTKSGEIIGGACRQLLREYAPDAKVFVADSKNLEAVREFSVQELLPSAFIIVS